MLIGIVGFVGAGKGTIGNMIKDEFDYSTDSYAAPLKDIASILFDWDRDLLEGDTTESRKWRNDADRYWSDKLDIKNFDPRMGLQLLGTEAIRQTFHPDFWVLSLMNRWENNNKKNTVIMDCRFPNEINTVRENNGYIIHVQQGENPPWYNDILFANQGFADDKDLENIKMNRILGSIPHISETSWIGCNIDYKIENNGTLEELSVKVHEVMGSILEKTNG